MNRRVVRIIAVITRLYRPCSSIQTFKLFQILIITSASEVVYCFCVIRHSEFGQSRGVYYVEVNYLPIRPEPTISKLYVISDVDRDPIHEENKGGVLAYSR